MTTGTKTAATRSTRRSMGALLDWASSTSRMIWERTMSWPTRAARKTRKPRWFSVAPQTSASFSLATGRLSPVSMDSSTLLAPSMTTPSTGIFSPGRTTTRSPTATWARGTSTSWPSRRRRAVGGARAKRRRMASEARPRERASSQRPRRMKVMIMTVVSKYTAGVCPAAATVPGKNVTQAE